ncbi:MAG TPA: Gfo/Idh/MocA family oxidoreductase [Longimicrobiales bacterium]|nr:Gfo/Idh/MocA family oxidoreductase [Longimicrobiales bacterium]
MTTPTRPRIGVAGVGSLGFHHARILSSMDGVVMAGIFDARPDRVREVAATLGVPAHATLESLLGACDALVVAVPTTAHEVVATAALAAGKPVLVEKPLAPDLAAADRILAAAARHGHFVQTGHSERFNQAVLAAEPFLDGPLFVESHRLAPFTPRSTDVPVVLDLMIHDVDLVMSLVGRPLKEFAASGVPVLTPSVDIANARLTFEGGAVANLTASRVSMERMRKLRLFQPSGYLSLNLADGSGEFLRLKRGLSELQEAAAEGPPAAMGLADIVERIPLAGDGAEPLRRELENFRDAVLGERPPAVSGNDGRAALAVALAIQERIELHVSDSRPA